MQNSNRNISHFEFENSPGMNSVELSIAMHEVSEKIWKGTKNQCGFIKFVSIYL